LIKKILIILLLIVNLYADNNNTKEQSSQDIDSLISIVKSLDTNELIDLSKAYIDTYTTPENKESVKLLYKDVKEKINNFSQKNILDKLSYKTFNVKQAQNVTYEVRVIKKDNIKGSGTAVAISKDGKLITAYHNIESYKNITVIDNNFVEYNVSVGEVSTENDLAYLYIEVDDIPFVKLVDEIDLGEKIYILSYENLLLTGLVSQIKQNGVILNIEAKKGTSGGGIFNEKNELVAILLNKDILDKTSFAATPKIFNTIVNKYQEKVGLNLATNNYDYSYCNDKDDLELWDRYSKSQDLKVQEYHALFIGLCEKVKNKDLTTEMAQHIFGQTKIRLFGK